MAKLAELKPGFSLIVERHGPHPAVVMISGSSHIEVLCGTGTVREYQPQVCVKRGCAAARAMGLTKDTYFYVSGMAIVSDQADVLRVGNRCPPEVFHRLEAVFIEARRRARSRR
jgi:hypothetical protein